MSLSMFSIIPTPQIWSENALSLMIPFFPLVGAIIGALWYGIFILLQSLNVPLMLSAVILALCPLILSGFIHIDGYMDTSDAIFSRAPLEKKKAILKDSHVGAFAVIAFVTYALLMVAGVYSFLQKENNPLMLIFIPMFSRCISATFMLAISPMSQTGYAASFKKDTKPIHIIAVAFWAVLCIVLSFLTVGVFSIYIILIELLCGAICGVYVVNQLKGISGDLCGFIMSVSELCAIIALAVI